MFCRSCEAVLHHLYEQKNLLLVSGHYKLVIILASLVAMYGYVAEPDNS